MSGLSLLPARLVVVSLRTAGLWWCLVLAALLRCSSYCIPHHFEFFFCGGCFGATLGFTAQTFANVIHYPWNIGGRPDFSWPPFIIITFELMVLFSALPATFGMILLNGLPRHHHPLFEVEAFDRASQDRFFLVIHSGDAKFDMQDTKTFLSGLDPLSLEEVPKV